MRAAVTGSAAAQALAAATAAKKSLKEAREVERAAAAAYDGAVEKAKWRIWRTARLVACTASSGMCA